MVERSGARNGGDVLDDVQLDVMVVLAAGLLVGELEIVDGDGRAVAPLQIVTQLKVKVLPSLETLGRSVAMAGR